MIQWLFPAICAGVLLAAPLTYLFWYRGGRPDARILRFEQLCAGKIRPGSSGMVFVGEDRAASPPNSDIPEFLYAAHLWGCGKVVPNEARARLYFEQWSPEFPKVEYVVVYGTERPKWLPADYFQLASEEAGQQLFIFRRISRG